MHGFSVPGSSRVPQGKILIETGHNPFLSLAALFSRHALEDKKLLLTAAWNDYFAVTGRTYAGLTIIIVAHPLRCLFCDGPPASVDSGVEVGTGFGIRVGDGNPAELCPTQFMGSLSFCPLWIVKCQVFV